MTGGAHQVMIDAFRRRLPENPSGAGRVEAPVRVEPRPQKSADDNRMSEARCLL